MTDIPMNYKASSWQEFYTIIVNVQASSMVFSLAGKSGPKLNLKAPNDTVWQAFKSEKDASEKGKGKAEFRVSDSSQRFCSAVAVYKYLVNTLGVKFKKGKGKGGGGGGGGGGKRRAKGGGKKGAAGDGTTPFVNLVDDEAGAEEPDAEEPEGAGEGAGEEEDGEEGEEEEEEEEEGEGEEDDEEDDDEDDDGDEEEEGEGGEEGGDGAEDDGQMTDAEDDLSVKGYPVGTIVKMKVLMRPIDTCDFFALRRYLNEPDFRLTTFVEKRDGFSVEWTITGEKGPETRFKANALGGGGTVKGTARFRRMFERPARFEQLLKVDSHARGDTNFVTVGKGTEAVTVSYGTHEVPGVATVVHPKDGELAYDAGSRKAIVAVAAEMDSEAEDDGKPDSQETVTPQPAKRARTSDGRAGPSSSSARPSALKSAKSAKASGPGPAPARAPAAAAALVAAPAPAPAAAAALVAAPALAPAAAPAAAPAPAPAPAPAAALLAAAAPAPALLAAPAQQSTPSEAVLAALRLIRVGLKRKHHVWATQQKAELLDRLGGDMTEAEYDKEMRDYDERVDAHLTALPLVKVGEAISAMEFVAGVIKEFSPP